MQAIYFLSLEITGPSDGLYVDQEGNNMIRKDSGGLYLNWVNQVPQGRGKTKGGIDLQAWRLGTLFSYLKMPLGIQILRWVIQNCC